MHRAVVRIERFRRRMLRVSTRELLKIAPMKITGETRRGLRRRTVQLAAVCIRAHNWMTLGYSVIFTRFSTRFAVSRHHWLYSYFYLGRLFVPRVRSTLSYVTSFLFYLVKSKRRPCSFTKRFHAVPAYFIYLSPLSSRVSLWRNGALFQRRPSERSIAADHSFAVSDHPNSDRCQ